jgi:hypothetical protein
MNKLQYRKPKAAMENPEEKIGLAFNELFSKRSTKVHPEIKLHFLIVKRNIFSLTKAFYSKIWLTTLINQTNGLKRYKE